MNIYSFVSIIICFIALIAYINTRIIKLPSTIAIMAGAILLSGMTMAISYFGIYPLDTLAYDIVSQFDFEKFLMQGILSLLLFAGSLHVDLDSFKRYRAEIFTLAFVGTIASTFLIGAVLHYCLSFTTTPLPLPYCLIFGALISPTDPIAVLALFKQLDAPKSLGSIVSGESLFNDGVGVVLFLTLIQLISGGEPPTIGHLSLLFLQQAVGGLALGTLLGYIGYHLIVTCHDFKTEMFLSLAIAMGGYLMANELGTSGPLAMVAAGIFIGNYRRHDHNRQYHLRSQLYEFWELIDEILNGILFFLLGLELLLIHYNAASWRYSVLAVLIVLCARIITVGIPLHFFKQHKKFPPNTAKIIIWGGLRGGLAVALALSLPASLERDLILNMTYAVVVFSVIVQGLSMRRLLSLKDKKLPH